MATSSAGAFPDGSTFNAAITPRMERRNRFVFTGAYLLTLFAAPVIYVGVVQAALCHQLGASASVANLPSAAFLFGNLAPFFLSWAVPHRSERAVVVWSNALTAVSYFLICVVLVMPLSNSIRITAVIGQGLLQGFCGSTSLVFMYQCLGRGTTLVSRAVTLKLAFTVAPMAAVAGSLGAQFLLSHGIPWLAYPTDFAFIYFIATLCMTGVALLARRFDLTPVAEEERPALIPYLQDSVAQYVRVRSLVVLWVAYALWYSTLAAMPNLSLYAKEALGRDPKELSGLIMAIRFGGKSLIGYGLGVLALRSGIRAPLVATVSLLGASTVWAWFAPGYSYLLSFAMMGGGELGGAYFPNYIVSVSPVAWGVRNLSLLTLATPFASLGALLHGAFADRWGFHASFLFGLLTAAAALLLVARLPAGPAVTNSGEQS